MHHRWWTVRGKNRIIVCGAKALLFNNNFRTYWADSLKTLGWLPIFITKIPLFTGKDFYTISRIDSLGNSHIEPGVNYVVK